MLTLRMTRGNDGPSVQGPGPEEAGGFLGPSCRDGQSHFAHLQPQAELQSQSQTLHRALSPPLKLVADRGVKTVTSVLHTGKKSHRPKVQGWRVALRASRGFHLAFLLSPHACWCLQWGLQSRVMSKLESPYNSYSAFKEKQL